MKKKDTLDWTGVESDWTGVEVVGIRSDMKIKEIIDFDPENTWHVYPVNDSKKHKMDGTKLCWCNPKIEVQPNRALIIVHNSKDGREFAEKKLVIKQ